MTVFIAGMGCVTPLGATPAEVWAAVRAGKRVEPVEMLNPESGQKYAAAIVPARHTAHLAREARLRRSSAISLLGAAAAKSAMESSVEPWTPGSGARLAIVLAVSSGGVQYTRRFYEQVVKQGANAASPMLFPETVYNAPASHVAAMLGLNEATYTLVGDGSVGLQALSFGAQLLALGDADQVLVVAAEELDWILLEAHHDWRLIADGNRPGAILAEGAAAVLLTSKETPLRISIHDGHSFAGREEAAGAIAAALGDLPGAAEADLVVTGENDTWTDVPIEAALQSIGIAGLTPRIAPKRQLGEALGAGALLQVVLGAAGLTETNKKRALIASLGWNQQATAALLERSD
jgi:3-oxoacyl-(acyl-carrier-protein) synthase